MRQAELHRPCPVCTKDGPRHTPHTTHDGYICVNPSCRVHEFTVKTEHDRELLGDAEHRHGEPDDRRACPFCHQAGTHPIDRPEDVWMCQTKNCDVHIYAEQSLRELNSETFTVRFYAPMHADDQTSAPDHITDDWNKANEHARETLKTRAIECEKAAIIDGNGITLRKFQLWLGQAVQYWTAQHR